MKSIGLRSLMSCLPESLVVRLPDVMPIAVQGKESKCVSYHDHEGTELYKSPSIHAKSIFEFATLPDTSSAATCFRDKLRDLMLEGVNIQWGKKCIGYDESDNEVWAMR